MEYIIPDLTNEEIKTLENNDVDFFPDDLLSTTFDAVIGSAAEFHRAMALLGRNL